MTPERFHTITQRYPHLRIAVVGDFCLDRYLEIDPARREISIETGLEVYNVTRVRSQPGAAGTILNNLAALGVGTIFPVGFCGDDGEGYELVRSLGERSGVRLDYFVRTTERRTFTYCKPLIMEPGKPPRELNRLDSKNWLSTPDDVTNIFIGHLKELATKVDAIILMDQVDVPDTGVVTHRLLSTIAGLANANPNLLILADSRRSLRDYPAVTFKMNAAELTALTGEMDDGVLSAKRAAEALAQKQQRDVFVTLAERGMIGAEPNGHVAYVPSLPLRGEIDIVGAGDSVTANLTTALAAGANAREAMQLAMCAASLVIHQLGTTGTASVPEIGTLHSQFKFD